MPEKKSTATTRELKALLGSEEGFLRPMVERLVQEALEAEMREQGPTIQVVIRDQNGTVVNRVDGPTSAGVHRVAWEFEYSSKSMISLEGGGGFYAARLSKQQ